MFRHDNDLDNSGKPNLNSVLTNLDFSGSYLMGRGDLNFPIDEVFDLRFQNDPCLNWSTNCTIKGIIMVKY